MHAIACRTLGIRHLRTRPRHPQTNGKAERFIRTMLAGWAHSAIYASSTERTQALDGWLFHYNHRRRHQALGRQTPITRLNNLLGTYNQADAEQGQQRPHRQGRCRRAAVQRALRRRSRYDPLRHRGGDCENCARRSTMELDDGLP